MKFMTLSSINNLPTIMLWSVDINTNNKTIKLITLPETNGTSPLQNRPSFCPQNSEVPHHHTHRIQVTIWTRGIGSNSLKKHVEIVSSRDRIRYVEIRFVKRFLDKCMQQNKKNTSECLEYDIPRKQYEFFTWYLWYLNCNYTQMCFDLGMQSDCKPTSNSNDAISLEAKDDRQRSPIPVMRIRWIILHDA